MRIKLFESFSKDINERHIEEDSIKDLIKDHLIDLDEFDVEYEIDEDTLTIIDYSDHTFGNLRYEELVRNDKILSIIERLIRLLLDDEFIIEELSVINEFGTGGYVIISKDQNKLVNNEWIEVFDIDEPTYWAKKFLIYED